MGGRDDPRGDVDRLLPADALELTILKHAE
jgi:hypothetical protein